MLQRKTERHYGFLVFSIGLIILFQSLAIGRDASRLEMPALTILMPIETGPAQAPSLPRVEPPRATPQPPPGSAPAVAATTSERTVAGTPATQALSVEPPAGPAIEDLTYTVRKNDTFYSVARQFGLTARDLAAANGLVRPWAPTGSVLRIPRRQPPTLEGGRALPRQMTYRVRAGDTLSNIAERFGMNPSDLLIENQLLSGKEPKSGSRLRVLVPPVIQYKVRSGESLWKLSKTFEVSLASLVELNNLALQELSPGQLIRVPVKDPAVLDRIWRSRHPADSSRFRFPVRGRLTDLFGRRVHPINQVEDFHRGIDIAADSGTLIRAARAGVVGFAGLRAGYGRLVVVKHADGTETWYGHCSRLLARAGASVKAGDKLARVGSSGTATGPHLHFEIRRGERAVNPLKYLKG